MDFIAELKRAFIYYKPDAENVRVGPCPNCGARHSLSVNIHGDKVPQGTWRCWACPISGSWNDLAKRYNLKKLSKNNLTNEAARLVSKHTKKIEGKTPQDFEMQEWHGKWRGVSENLLKALGAKLWMDTYIKQDKPIIVTPRLYLPVTKYEEEIGYIAAIRDKKDRIDRYGNERKDKYKNSPGEWAKDVLWPMDFVGNTKIVGLVEGPYDVLKPLDYGIPILGFLGVQNWNIGKASILASLGVEIVVPLTDNDPPGQRCSERIVKDLEDSFTIKYFPYEEKDPGCMKKDTLKLLSKMFSIWTRSI